MKLTVLLLLKGCSKNVVPAKAGIHDVLKYLNSHLRGSDRKLIIRGPLKLRGKQGTLI